MLLTWILDVRQNVTSKSGDRCKAATKHHETPF